MAGVTTGGGEAGGLDELARRWQAAEDRLYPVVMVRPEAYASAVTLVRAVVDRLGGVVTADDLAAAYTSSAHLVADVVHDTGVATEGLDLALVAGAAFNIRYRDLRASAQREQAKQRIRDAAAAGSDWAVLFETGRPDLAPLSPYRRLEMRLADGVGLHASITVDPATANPVYAVETVQLDPATGDWVHEAEPSPGTATYQTTEEWEAAINRIRGRSDPPPQHS
jgi:hypothetical protein